VQTDPIRTARLSGTRSGNVEAFLSSMVADTEIATADLLVDMAHLLMLVKVGLIPSEPAKQLMEVLVHFHNTGLPESVFNPAYEDIHAGIEAALTKETGPQIAGRLHMGRSRNDEVATCIHIRLKEKIILILSELLAVRKALLYQVRLSCEVILPGFTHLQYAQPTTLGHYLLAYEEALTRDYARFSDAYKRTDRSPLGSSAFASTGFKIDREYTRELLGFEALALNTMDAVAARDSPLEVLGAASVLMTTVSRLCEDFVIWSSGFAGFIEIDDLYCSTSSVMPQKKNPDTAEIMRSKSGSVSGALFSALTIVKGLPMSYNRDLQELTPHLWRSMNDVILSLKILAPLIESIKWNTEKMAEECKKGYSTATELADTLVRSYDLPFRTAHHIVGRAVKMGDLHLSTLDTASKEEGTGSLSGRGLNESIIENSLDPITGIERRIHPGAPAPAEVKRAESYASSRIVTDEIENKKRREKMDGIFPGILKEKERLSI